MRNHTVIWLNRVLISSLKSSIITYVYVSSTRATRMSLLALLAISTIPNISAPASLSWLPLPATPNFARCDEWYSFPKVLPIDDCIAAWNQLPKANQVVEWVTAWMTGNAPGAVNQYQYGHTGHLSHICDKSASSTDSVTNHLSIISQFFSPLFVLFKA